MISIERIEKTKAGFLRRKHIADMQVVHLRSLRDTENDFIKREKIKYQLGKAIKKAERLRYKAKNPDKVILQGVEYSKKYAERDREKRYAWVKDWGKRNPDKVREYSSRRKGKYRGKYRERNRIYIKRKREEKIIEIYGSVEQYQKKISDKLEKRLWEKTQRQERIFTNKEQRKQLRGEQVFARRVVPGITQVTLLNMDAKVKVLLLLCGKAKAMLIQLRDNSKPEIDEIDRKNIRERMRERRKDRKFRLKEKQWNKEYYGKYPEKRKASTEKWVIKKYGSSHNYYKYLRKQKEEGNGQKND